MVYARKKYGQHFLTDQNIARKIADSLILINKVYSTLLEIGPGSGSLTRFIHEKHTADLWLIEIDKALADQLKITYPDLAGKILNTDFLSLSLDELFHLPIGIIGNFPYNISSQIVIKILENRRIIPEVVGMFQKEVAERLAARPGSRNYGRLSVLTQAFYDVTILFKVSPKVFIPEPKVESAVIRMIRKEDIEADIPEQQFFSVVKAAFGQRRKTLKNALKSAGFAMDKLKEVNLERRAEELDIQEFIFISKLLVHK